MHFRLGSDRRLGEWKRRGRARINDLASSRRSSSTTHGFVVPFRISATMTSVTMATSLR